MLDSYQPGCKDKIDPDQPEPATSSSPCTASASSTQPKQAAKAACSFVLLAPQLSVLVDDIDVQLHQQIEAFCEHACIVLSLQNPSNLTGVQEV